MTARPDFAGPFKDQLNELADLIDWLATEHNLSFVTAGDDQVFAFGGDGLVLVFDQSRWEGTIELMTPNGALTIKPGEDGKISVTGSGLDEAGFRQLLEDGVSGIKNYYDNRYWSTPTGS